MEDFVHLHRHSEWSVLDGTGTAQQYAEKAAELGQGALAITDHGTLSGVLHHIDACSKVKIRPISGIEAYYRPDRLEHTQENKKYWHLVLLANGLQGWRSLMRIASEAYSSGFYYKPCVDLDLLSRNSDGVIALSACMSGYLPHMLTHGSERDIKQHIAEMRQVFGENYYIEIMPHGLDEQRELNPMLVNCANEIGAPLVATVDAHYPYEDWADTQDVLLMISTGQTQLKRKAKREATGEDVYELGCKTLYLMPEEAVRAQFAAEHPAIPDSIVDEAIKNTSLVASSCDPFTLSKTDKLPRAEGSSRRINQWCEEGLQRIGKESDPVYRERLEHELQILSDKKVLEYFVLVGDMVRWAKAQGIRVGAGRGSAAGCLVSYLVGITSIDPIAYGLLFERFLNPQRRVLPDIDLDFQHDRRDEVKAHLADTHGADHVADIVAHSTFGAKSAIQSVARVHDVDFVETLKITKSIEDTDLTIPQLININEAIAKYAQKYPEVLKHAIRLEGQLRAISKHAAGVVITPEPVSDYMPTMRAKDGSIITAWSDSAAFPIISDYGFVKIDTLSTDGLTKQQYATDLVKVNRSIEIDLDALPIISDPGAADPVVLEQFCKGRTLGVFQFESPGISSLLKDIQPDHIRDVIAANALYRPGPLEGGMTRSYAERKHGRVKFDYFHPDVEDILKETYGLIIYQEQVMRICQRLGGFSMAEADEMRKAIGKLYRLPGDQAQAYMNRFRSKWDEGCSSKGVDRDVSERIWSMILAFGGYGFNLSHAAAYSVQAYQDMWLKTHYPLEFYAAFLTFDPDKAQRTIREARRVGVDISPPDINTSDVGFTVDFDNNAILFGLRAIRNVGEKAVETIKEFRPYESIDDFIEKVPARRCNSRVRESLIAAGAFDCFGARKDWVAADVHRAEREFLGASLTVGKQVIKYRDVIVNRYFPEEETRSMHSGEGVIIGGEVVSSRTIKTKRKQDMCFLNIEFEDNKWRCVLFPDAWAQYESLIVLMIPVMIVGRVDDRGSIIVDEMQSLESLAETLKGEKVAS